MDELYELELQYRENTHQIMHIPHSPHLHSKCRPKGTHILQPVKRSLFLNWTLLVKGYGSVLNKTCIVSLFAK